MATTVTEILAGVRRRLYSTDPTSWPDADIIALVNEVVKGQVVPWIEKAREGHFLKSSDTALVAGQSSYVMPTDVMAAQLFSVHLADSSGNAVAPPLVETALEDFAQLYASQGTPQRYAFRGNEVLLWPTPSDASYKLRLQYARRPSELVSRAEVVQVTALTQAGGNFVVTYTDTSPAAFASGVAYDLVKASAGFEVYPAGTAVAFNSAAKTVTFTGLLTSFANVAVGDFLCLSRQAPVLTYIPEAVWPVVYQATVVEMSTSKGDDEQLARAEKALDRMIKAAAPFFQKRATAAHRKIPGVGRFGSAPWNRLIRPG